MSTNPRHTLLTDEEFMSLADQPGKQELLDGELFTLPPAKRSHTRAAQRFYRALLTQLPESLVYIEGGYQLRSGRWLQPDVSVQWDGQAVENDYLQGSPRLAIEIVSRANTPKKIERKLALLFEDGALEAWVFDPKTRSMRVYFNHLSATHNITGFYRSEEIGVSIDLNTIVRDL